VKTSNLITRREAMKKEAMKKTKGLGRVNEGMSKT
jgi:hypothetical protein